MEKINNKNIKISFIINILTVIMTIAALSIAFSGFKFMHGYEPSSELSDTQIFSYFTVQANTFMGIVSFVFAIKELQILKGTKKVIPLRYYILKMIATVAVSLTFLVVFGYLGFASKGGIASLLRNSNLFFHLIINILSFQNIFSIFPLIASIIVIISFMMNNENYIRGIGVISALCWLVYAIVYKSYVSIVFEGFTLLGTFIAFVKNSTNSKAKIKEK